MASNSSTNPRIHFKGKYVADVPTSNNDHGQNIDVGTLALYIKRPDGSLQANFTDEEFKNWQADAVANYKTNAGYWNLNGSNSFWWEDTTVTSGKSGIVCTDLFFKRDLKISFPQTNSFRHTCVFIGNGTRYSNTIKAASDP